MEVEKIVLDRQRNVTLTAYIQATGGAFSRIPCRPAVLILPGGGYQYCSDRESDPVAFAFLKAGFQTFILRYSVGRNAAWPNPLEDYESAMELIRGKADEWNLCPDKIAVIGFSAGGHLAAAAATMSRNRPDAAILGYAVTGEDVKGCNPTAPGAVAAVDKNTCPCFVFATASDEIVPVENSIEMIRALAREGISFESHIYGYGPHGFSTCDSAVQDLSGSICDRAPDWVEDSIGWLKEYFGDFGDGVFAPPKFGKYINGDREPVMNIHCTVGKLMGNEQVRRLLPELAAQADAMGDNSGLAKMTLSGLLGFQSVPKAELEALDQKLRQISNE